MMEHAILSLIAAIQLPDYGVGMENKLLCSFSEDIKRFKTITSGHPVIMGRLTWDSLPAKWKPLPNRTNIVLSQNPEHINRINGEGATAVGSFAQALEIAQVSDGGDHIFAIGGRTVWKEAAAYADQIYLTEFSGQKPADTFFPQEVLEDFDWKMMERFIDEKTKIEYLITLLIRKIPLEKK